VSAGLVARSPAKVNLFLRVLGRRPDGYHEIETLFHAVTLFDEVLVRRALSGVRLEVVQHSGGDPVPAGEENLVHRAARLFLERTGNSAGVSILLTKRIPAGGGLGGGSGDAAATLRLLDRLFPGERTPELMHALAAELGSDVPFFVDARTTAIGRGRGEQLEPVVPFPELHLVLLLPPFACGTAAVYELAKPSLTRTPGPASVLLDKIRSDKELQVSDGLVNDLESPARTLRPELAQLAERVRSLGLGRVHLSGSGSTCFLAYRNAEAASDAAHRLAEDLNADRVRIERVRSVTRDEWAIRER
jgi:4-diphosphocytidyl-2-C-methyl-D-erythritol kinase